jgi:hypothetical protein
MTTTTATSTATTAAATTRPSTARALAVVLALTANLAVVPAAAAAPAGPTDVKDQDPYATITVDDHCLPAPGGFTYQIDVHGDAATPWTYTAYWREKDDPQESNVVGQSGSVATGEGSFLVKGVARHVGPGDQILAKHETAWTPVTVFCPGLKQPEGGDRDPQVTIDLEPRCDVEPAGFGYDIEVEDAPAGPLAHQLQWRASGGGPVTTQAGPSGLVDSGEGSFEARGVLHHQGPGFYASDWVEVVVDCSDDPDDEEEDDPDVVTGTPTFTG